ncbi:MAG: hypothetical protein ACPGVK_07740 [Halocynthiibacter sp.]
MFKKTICVASSIFMLATASVAYGDIVTEPKIGYQVELPEGFVAVKGRAGLPSGESETDTRYAGFVLIGIPANGPKLKDARSEPDFTSHMGSCAKEFTNETANSIDIECVNYQGDKGAEMIVRHLHEVHNCEAETTLAMIEFVFFMGAPGTKEDFIHEGRETAQEIFSTLKPCK